MSIPQFCEIAMLCLFGCSWPFNIAKALKAKTAKGKSIGFELLIPQFREALAEVLNAPQPLVGVLLARKEAEALCRRLGLSERVQMNIEQLWKALKADPDTQIVELAGLARHRALRSLEQWAREYAK